MKRMECGRKRKKRVSTPSASYELDDSEDGDEGRREVATTCQQPDGYFWHQICKRNLTPYAFLPQAQSSIQLFKAWNLIHYKFSRHVVSAVSSRQLSAPDKHQKTSNVRKAVVNNSTQILSTQRPTTPVTSHWLHFIDQTCYIPDPLQGFCVPQYYTQHQGFAIS